MGPSIIIIVIVIDSELYQSWIRRYIVVLLLSYAPCVAIDRVRVKISSIGASVNLRPTSRECIGLESVYLY